MLWLRRPACPVPRRSVARSLPLVRDVHPTALKHGLSAQRAVQAAHWSQWVEPLEQDGWPHRELRLGFDTQARLLETVVLIFEGDDETIIHAMPAREKYWNLLP